MTPRGLNHTAVLVLGLIAEGDANGWDVIRTVEAATRHFWSASRGGIYPELRRLEAAGLLHSVSHPRGDVARHKYAITAAGRHALAEWLASEDPGIFEMRHEDLLRLFFAGGLTVDRQVDLLRRIRGVHELKIRDLEQTTGASPDGTTPRPRLLTRDYGLALNRAAVQWCLDTENRLVGVHRD